jgi:hypothetical protein
MARLRQLTSLFTIIGPGLTRLVMDLQPMYTPQSDVNAISPHIPAHNIFVSMTALQELVCSFDTLDYFSYYPPPNLKRWAVTYQGHSAGLLYFASRIASLETLLFLRAPDMAASCLDTIFDSFSVQRASRQAPLDLLLVDVSANHITPSNSRDWTEDDPVRVWEVDVPKSYYGDEDDLILCDAWIWENAVQGTLWRTVKRRMKSWGEVRRILESDEVD